MVTQPPPCLTTEILDPDVVVQEGQPVLDSYPAFSCQFKNDSFGYSVVCYFCSAICYRTAWKGGWRAQCSVATHRTSVTFSHQNVKKLFRPFLGFLTVWRAQQKLSHALFFWKAHLLVYESNGREAAFLSC